MRRSVRKRKQRAGTPLPPSVFAGRNGNKKPKKLLPGLVRRFPWRLLPHPLANPPLDWSLSLQNFLKDKSPKPPANRTAVSENLFLNSRLKRQHQRQSREPSLATAANGVGAEEAGAGTKARELARLSPQRPSLFP
jgi:hypothetical protein